jgi:DNA polymerase I-like protein with 3'-5' exonuclease and polymerase domains/uracil-DNA glycosylase
MAQISPSYPDGSRMLIIQCHPTSEDIQSGVPNSSQSGKMLKSALFKAGIAPSDVSFDYLTTTYPGLRGLATEEAQDALRNERKHLLNRVRQANFEVILLIGEAVKTEWGIKDSFRAVRGFIFPTANGLRVPTICTFNPQSLFSGQSHEEITFMNDLIKAIEISQKGWLPPKENFLLAPSVQDVREWARSCLTEHPTLYVDIESTGDLHKRDRNNITMIGMYRRDLDQALVVPIRDADGYYWDLKEWPYVQEYVRECLSACECVFHNGEFDVKHLNYQGFGPVRIGGDTILLHHALHPELPHDLGYVTSVHGKIPYWKGTLKNAKNQSAIDPLELRAYNARDCVATGQIEQELIIENFEQGTLSTYTDISVPMLSVVLEMNANGLPVDAKRLVRWKLALSKNSVDLLFQMKTLWTIHPEFNWSSDHQVAYLFYGELPASHSTKEADYAKYFVEGCKLKRDTKKFALLEEYINIYKDTKPFRKVPKLNVKRGKKGSSVDDEMRLRLKTSSINRMIEIDGLKSPEARADERSDLEQMVRVLEALGDFAGNEKLLKTYTNLHIEPDGRVHVGFKVHGTRTGRLSSYSPNGQNIPKEAKKIFVAPEGWKFVSFDYSNLELVVLAYVAGIQHYINVFQRGLNVHTENTKLFLGITEDNPNWDKWRRALKVYVFGRNYGGTVKGIYRRLLTEVKGLRMTLKQFEKLDRDYFAKLPEYKKWYDETEDTLRSTRILHNSFGRIRIFLGDIEACVRAGLNFPIQSTAADIMAYGLINFKRVLDSAKRKRSDIKTQPVLTVHDSLVLLVPEREILMATKMLKRTMCAPVNIGGQMITFTGDITVGDDLASGDEYKIDDAIAEYQGRKDEATGAKEVRTLQS